MTAEIELTLLRIEQRQITDGHKLDDLMLWQQAHERGDMAAFGERAVRPRRIEEQTTLKIGRAHV